MAIVSLPNGANIDNEAKCLDYIQRLGKLASFLPSFKINYEADARSARHS